MFNVHRLDPSDWDILRRAEDGYMPDKTRTIAVVATDDVGEIIGRTFLLAPTHLEGTWVRASQRSGLVLKRLMDQIEIEAAREGITQLLSYSATNEVADYLRRLKYVQLPLTIWEKKIKCL